MSKRPLILIAPSSQRSGVEFDDASISLSNRYTQTILAAGGVPFISPCLTSKKDVAESVARCDGVLLTGGDDVDPRLYSKKLPGDLLKTISDVEPERDVFELLLIREVFRQRRPLLAICRGHQILNVALGGDLIVDISLQVPSALNHRQMDLKSEKVHEVTLTPDSALAKVTGKRMLGVNSTHHQSVGRVAKPLRVTALSSDGIVEAMELKDFGLLPYLIAVQFHPERLADRYKEFLQLFESFVLASQQG